jgi:hypothetical protein
MRRATTAVVRIAFISTMALLAPAWAGVATATDRYVATTGVDAANNCSVLASPCATLQHAVNQSVSNDTIHVAAGTYAVAGLVTINKTLTLRGAQAGVDARTRVGAESVLSNSQGLVVSASGVVVDGFTIQDSTNTAFTGYGIWLNGAGGADGTRIVNNIFQDNIAGLGLGNAGAAQAVIQHNLFRNNNVGNVAAAGTGIYTDQFVGGGSAGVPVTNVMIDANTFVNNKNAGIGFSSTDPSHPDTNITITNNLIENCGRGVYFFNTQTATVTGNTIKTLTVPTDGGTSVGVGVFGAVSDLSIMLNDIQSGPARGIRIGAFGGMNLSNTNVAIHLNNIFGFADAGMFVDDAAPSFLPALVGPANFATCNWWGSNTGPTSPLNAAGTGDAVKGALAAPNFNPWLLGLAPNAPCGGVPLPLESIMTDSYTLRSWNPNVPDDVLVDVAAFNPPSGMIDFANDDITLQFGKEPGSQVFSRFTIPAGTWTSYQGGLIRQVSSTFVDQITGHTLYALVRITKSKPWRISVNTKAADYTALEGPNHQRIRFVLTIGPTVYAGDQCFQRLSSGDLYWPPRPGVVCP